MTITNSPSWEFDFAVEPGESLAVYTARAAPFLREKYDAPGNPPPDSFIVDQAELRFEAQMKAAKRGAPPLPRSPHTWGDTSGQQPQPPPPAAEDRDRLGELIDDMNKRYAVVSEGGTVLAFRQQYDPAMRRNVIVRMTFASLKNLYLNRRLTVTDKRGSTTKTHAEWWLTDRRRRTYDNGIVFDPTNSVDSSYFNLWCGYFVSSQSGDWTLMREHIRLVLCSGNPEHFRYFIFWLARLFQRPELAGEVAIVLRSEKRGVGKGLLMQRLAKILGQYYMHVSDPEHLVGRFNSHLQDCVLLFADESHFAGDRKHQGSLQRLITEPYLAIEKKFVDVIMSPNFLHVVIASNFSWVVPVALVGERRYFVPVLDESRAGDAAYFSAIVEQMENGGDAAMLHDLLNIDLSGFNVRAIPDSGGLIEQKINSLDSVPKWWLAVLNRGFAFKSKFGTPLFSTWAANVATELLWQSYLQWCDETRELRRQPREQLGKFLQSTIGYQQIRPRGSQPIGEVEVLTPDPGVPRNLDAEAVRYGDHVPGYLLGSLNEARAAFSVKTGIVGDWAERDPGEEG